MANKTKINIERNYLNRGITFAGSDLFFQDTKSRIISISFFDNNRNIANRVSIQEFEPDDLTKMISRIDAQTMSYDSTTRNWSVHDGVKREFKNSKQTAQYFNTITLNYLSFTAEDLTTKQQKPEEMNLTELKNYIDSQQRAGNDPTGSLIEFHTRFAFPLASLVVVLFGLPISANKRKGGLAAQVGINILVTFIYLVFMKVSQAFGKNGALDPLLTAWFANFIFLAAAGINLLRQKAG